MCSQVGCEFFLTKNFTRCEWRMHPTIIISWWLKENCGLNRLIFKWPWSWCHDWWRPSVGPLRLSNGSLTEDPKIMSETMAKKFSSVYFARNFNYPAPHQAFCGNLWSTMITYESACKTLSTLDIEASIGPHGFHPKLLSSCKPLQYPICLIFRKSVQCGDLPAQWQITSPLFKKGLRNTLRNYRSINFRLL